MHTNTLWPVILVHTKWHAVHLSPSTLHFSAAAKRFKRRPSTHDKEPQTDNYAHQGSALPQKASSITSSSLRRKRVPKNQQVPAGNKASLFPDVPYDACSAVLNHTHWLIRHLTPQPSFAGLIRDLFFTNFGHDEHTDGINCTCLRRILQTLFSPQDHNQTYFLWATTLILHHGSPAAPSLPTFHCPWTAPERRSSCLTWICNASHGEPQLSSPTCVVRLDQTIGLFHKTTMVQQRL